MTSGYCIGVPTTSTTTVGTSIYYCPFSGTSQTSVRARFPIAQNTAKKLYVYYFSGPVDGEISVYVQKNGVDTALKVEGLTVGQVGTCEANVDFADGDTINFRVVCLVSGTHIFNISVAFLSQ